MGYKKVYTFTEIAPTKRGVSIIKPALFAKVTEVAVHPTSSVY